MNDQEKLVLLNEIEKTMAVLQMTKWRLQTEVAKQLPRDEMAKVMEWVVPDCAH